MQPTITTKRLILNLVTTDDHAFIQTLVNSKGWLEFIGERNVHSQHDAIAYINRINNTPDFTYWAVRLKSGSIPLGIISFIKRSYLENFDIGFAFLPEFQGSGYAFEAASEVLAIAGRDAASSPVLATTLPHNTTSIKLLEKLGLRFDREIEEDHKTLLVYTSAR